MILMALVISITRPLGKLSANAPANAASNTYETAKPCRTAGVIHTGPSSCAISAIAAINNAVSASELKNCAARMVKKARLILFRMGIGWTLCLAGAWRTSRARCVYSESAWGDLVVMFAVYLTRCRRKTTLSILDPRQSAHEQSTARYRETAHSTACWFGLTWPLHDPPGSAPRERYRKGR